MILQPLELICQTMPPPEDGSSLPLAALLDAETTLWQDFEYNHKTLNFMTFCGWLLVNALVFVSLVL